MNLQNDVKELFAYWIEERLCVLERKSHDDEKPWSDDPVFQTTYFCNVDREQDRVTKWIRERYSPHVDCHHFTANIVLSRFVNKPETLANLPYWHEYFEDQPDNIWCEVMSKPGAWGSAYIVSTNGRRQPKHEYIAGLLERLFTQLYGPPGTVLGGTLATAHRRLQAVQGLGSFMAAQVVADLKNTKGHPLADAEDWYAFAAPGPGSLRGLSRFHQRQVTATKFEGALASARQWLYNNGYKLLVQDLCNQNLQNCFCEFDKYVRVKNGEGRSKRKYNGV